MSLSLNAFQASWSKLDGRQKEMRGCGTIMVEIGTETFIVSSTKGASSCKIKGVLIDFVDKIYTHPFLVISCTLVCQRVSG